MPKNNFRWFALSGLAVCLSSAAQNTPVVNGAVQPATAQPAATSAPAPVAPVTVQVTLPRASAGGGRTLLDLGEIDREIEFATREDALRKIKTPAPTGAASMIMPMMQPGVPSAVASRAPVYAPAVRQGPGKPGKHGPAGPGMHLRAVYGVGDLRSAIFLLPNGRYVVRHANDTVGNWNIDSIGVSAVTLSKGRRTTEVLLDMPPVMEIGSSPRMGEANVTASNRNVIAAQPLGNPRLPMAQAGDDGAAVPAQ